MKQIRVSLCAFLLSVMLASAYGAEGVTLTYQAQVTTPVPGLFEGSPVTRVEVDVYYPFRGGVVDIFQRYYRTDAKVTEVRFANATGQATGDVTSVYATFNITNGNSGNVSMEHVPNENPDGRVILEFFGPFETPNSYNGNKPHSLVTTIDYRTNGNDFVWVHAGELPLPLPPNSAIDTLALPRSLSTVSNGVVTSNIFTRTRRFYIKPTNSISIANASLWPSFTFTAERWVRYQPEWTPILDQANWYPLGGEILTEATQVLTVSDTNNAIGQAFYRVRRQ